MIGDDVADDELLIAARILATDESWTDSEERAAAV